MIQLSGKNLCAGCFAQIPEGTEVCPHCGFGKKHKVVPGALPPGTILHAQYLLGATLGAGGFSITYRAYDTRAGKVVAVKEFFPSSLVERPDGELTVSVISSNNREMYEKYLKRFYEEAQILSTLNHPNIVRVFKMYYENDTAYYTMELLDGSDLNRYAVKKGGRISEEEMISITACVAEALETVHRRGLLHRDIAPDNIYMCRDGRVKLIDFGAARTLSMDGSRSLSVILKPGFAPVEQYQKRGKQGPWTDIYALGATMYLCLTGEMPLAAADRIRYPELNLQCSPALAQVIRKMMAVQIQDRYADVTAFKKDFFAAAVQISSAKQGGSPKKAEPAPSAAQAVAAAKGPSRGTGETPPVESKPVEQTPFRQPQAAQQPTAQAQAVQQPIAQPQGVQPPFRTPQAVQQPGVWGQNSQPPQPRGGKYERTIIYILGGLVALLVILLIIILLNL
ncbi:MAG: protein kinase [Clostridia bacterium]|nr:protein kinase [Clostridia bacterium]